MQKKEVFGIAFALLLLSMQFMSFQRTSADVAPTSSAFVITPFVGVLTVGDNFTISVNITNAQDLCYWQVILKYNDTRLRLDNLWIPDQNVFAGHMIGEYQDCNMSFIKRDATTGLAPILVQAYLFGDDSVGNVNNSLLFEANFTVRIFGKSVIEIASETDPVYYETSNPYNRWIWVSLWFNTPYETQYPLVSNCTVLSYSTGDVDHDFNVNMKDIGIEASAFGTVPNDPRWNPACDINHDGKIDLRDIALVAKDIGQHYP